MACWHLLESAALPAVLAQHVVAVIEQVLQRQAFCVLVPSAGRTLAATWACLRQQHAQAVDWQRVICLQMDEYDAMPCQDARGFAHQIETELVRPLSMGRFVTFFDERGDLRCPPSRYEAQCRAWGGIDCAVHGVGVNGHIGFNEPAASFNELAMTRCVDLSEATRTANGVDHRRGVTLGLGLLQQARHTVVALTGAHKQAAAEALFRQPQSPQQPVTCLRSLTHTHVFLDRAAAGTLEGQLGTMRA